MFAVVDFALHGRGKTIYKVEPERRVRPRFHSEKSHGSIYVRIILKKLPLARPTSDHFITSHQFSSRPQTGSKIMQPICLLDLYAFRFLSAFFCQLSDTHAHALAPEAFLAHFSSKLLVCHRVLHTSYCA